MCSAQLFAALPPLRARSTSLALQSRQLDLSLIGVGFEALVLLAVAPMSFVQMRCRLIVLHEPILDRGVECNDVVVDHCLRTVHRSLSAVTPHVGLARTDELELFDLGHDRRDLFLYHLDIAFAASMFALSVYVCSSVWSTN